MNYDFCLKKTPKKKSTNFVCLLFSSKGHKWNIYMHIVCENVISDDVYTLFPNFQSVISVIYKNKPTQIARYI